MSSNGLPAFGKWQAVEVLVGGAQGFAYRAVPSCGGGEQVFIKWFIGDLPEERFTREVEALMKIERGVGLPRIRNQGMRDGHPWIAIKFEEGVNLSVFASQNPQLSGARWLQIALNLTGALRNAHEAGVLHRDIKPPNIMIDEHDRTTLVDFGLAVIDDRHSQTIYGEALGTYEFIAPEGLQGLHFVTDRSDIFSLAATLTFLAYGGIPPAVRALGPFANEGWAKAASALPDKWMREVLWESLETGPVKRPTATKLFESLITIPVESVAASEGMTATLARRVGSTIARFAQNDDDWIRVRDWLLFAHELDNTADADYLARIVESTDGIEASIPYWRHFASQRPVMGNVMFYRALLRNPSITTGELNAANALLYEAGENGGFTTGHRGLGFELLALEDYSSALRALEPLGGKEYPVVALCRHRLGMPPAENPEDNSLKNFMNFTSAARMCRKRGNEEDAQWLEEQGVIVQ
jgi:serine/threonine protein kinase